jgi:chromosomal replication initiator protein
MNIWNQVLEKIQERVDKQSYDTWFEPVVFISYIDDTIHLQVPNDKFKSWIEKKYNGLIAETLKELGYFSLKINIFRPEKEGEAAPIEVEKPDAGYNPKYTFDTFVVGQSNQFAHAAARAVAEAPSKVYNPLFIYGGVGLGKTHLLHAIASYIGRHNKNLKVLYISSETFVNELIGSIRHENTIPFRERYRNNDILLVDDIQFLAGKERTQEEFFHTFNALYNAQKQIILSSDRPPREIPTLEERLTSRFEMGLLADIQPPEFETKIAILTRKAEIEGVRLQDDVSQFIASRVKSNIRELEGCLVRIIAYSSLTAKPITLEFVKEVLKDIWRDEDKPVTAEEIIKTVADYYKIKVKDLKAKDNRREIALPRQIAIYLTKKLTNLSLPEIGRRFGGKHHSTVIHSINKIDQMRKDETNFNNIINNLMQFF